MFRLFVNVAEKISEWGGRAGMGLALLLVFISAFETGERYIFHRSSTAIQELTWHFFALIFLLGSAYTLKCNGHVRVDILYDRMSERGRALVNILSVFLLLIPFCIMIIWFSWDWVIQAFLMAEKSSDPGGLPARWILKGALPLGFAMLLIQGLAETVKDFRVLFRKKA